MGDITVWKSADIDIRDPEAGITVSLDRLFWIKKLVLTGAKARPRRYPAL